MALFPRRIAGRYAALSRWDRKSNAVAYSDDAYDWSEARTVQSPARPCELIQPGNCSRPGWNREARPVPVPAVERKPNVSRLHPSRYATNE